MFECSGCSCGASCVSGRLDDVLSTEGKLFVEDLIRLEGVKDKISSVFGCSGCGCEETSVSGGLDDVLSIGLGSIASGILELISAAELV